jgi:HTH-type transcriptional regulator/antitoxin HigA
MDIKPIKTDRDYRRALKAIERLMDAEPNTPDGDALDTLAMLIDRWENERIPIESPDST